VKGVILNVALHGQKIQNSLVKIIVLIILFSFPTFCLFKYNDVPELPDSENEKEYDQKWEKYGAYYDKDEVILNSYYAMNLATSRIEIFKKIKILTTEGAEHGTIPVWRYAQTISHFEPHLYDANGTEIKLDVKKMRKTYSETDKVVFSKVTKGSVIVLRMAFTLRHTYYSGFNVWFSYDIPIRVGRFIHSISSNCKYEYKAYGNRYKFKADVYKKGHTKTWTISEYEPKPDIDFLDYKANTEPKIIVKLTNVLAWNKKFNTKKKIIKKFKNEIFGISLNFKGESFQKTLKSCISKTKDPLKRAKRILKWVQDNMTRTGEEHDLFGEVTKTEKASELQIACLCNTMFKKAGLKSNIVITGHKNEYTIDSTFIVKRDYITVPVPLVQINNKLLVAYPYRRGYELGEYPLSYNGVPCINIKEKKIQPLPTAKWGTIWIRKRRVLNLAKIPGNYKLIYEFKENSANVYRDDFLDSDKSALEGKFENWIKDYKKSNKLKSFEIKNLNEYDKPLQVIVHFENDDSPIPYGDKKIFQLKNFFVDYFEDITPDRKEDVFIHNSGLYIDEIEVLKIWKKKIEFDIKMKKPTTGSEPEVIHYIPSEDKTSGLKYDKISSQLFSVDYHKNETDSSYIFQRILKLNPMQVNKKDLKKLYNDCTLLNSIKNSSLIIH
jgi:hypothetical protein